MSASLRALLAGIVDYAGLFPPARLPLDQAIRNYARYRAGPDGWLLGRFICPASQLAELAPFREELFGAGPPLVVSALGRGGSDRSQFLDGVQADLEAIAVFGERHGERARVDGLEVRLPNEVVRQQRADAVAGLIEAVSAAIANRGFSTLTPYYESTLETAWRATAQAVISGSAKGQRAETPGANESWHRPGFKLRCGGLEASAFPTAEQVAFILTACRDAGVPFKATAGLHHPLRHFDSALQTHQHGFLNVFGAAVLAHARGLREAQVRRLVEEEDAGEFVFGDKGFHCQAYRATPEEIVQARHRVVISFGSCSFDEPRDGLRALGLLR
jgi:hypothetical protein